MSLRRSERLKAKSGTTAKIVDNNEHSQELAISTTSSCHELPKSRSHKSTEKSKSRSETSKKSEFRRHHAKLQFSLKKKELEQEELKNKQDELKNKQEILDLQYALQLARIEENEESISEDESCVSKPNISEWMKGDHPWETQEGRQRWERQESKNKNSKFTQIDNEVSSLKNEVRNSQLFSPTGNPPGVSQQITSSQLTRILTRQSMPKDLPVFTGNPLEWSKFLYQYKNSTSLCGYSQEENHCRLQKALKGQAYKIVQSLLIMPQNVDKIMNILERRFGQTEHIISMLLENAKNLPYVREDRLDILINFSDEVKNLIGTMQSLNAHDHLQNPILLQELLSKLPNSYKMMWIEYISNKISTDTKLVEFSIWLDQKAMSASQIYFPKFNFDSDNRDNQKSKQKFGRKEVTMTTTTKKNCICCNNGLHHLSTCSSFKDLDVNQRWDFVTAKKICFSCLIPYHSLSNCQRKKICNTNNCKKFHHTLLHNVNRINQPEVVPSTSRTDNETEVNCHISNNRRVLLKIIPVSVTCNNKSMNTYALLDDASTVTLIDQNLADYLELDGLRQHLCIQWTNNQTKEQVDSRTVSFTISAGNGGKEFQLRHVRTIRELSLPTQTVDMDEMRKRYAYIENNCDSLINAQPKILIGQDNWPLLISRKVISGPWNGPALTKTLLGWVLHGNICKEVIQSESGNSGVVCHISEGERKDDLDILHDLVKEQWKIDWFGLEKHEKNMSREDIRAQDILNRTMKRIGDRFETGLLWKDEEIILPESKSNAMIRLHYTERKMDKDKDYGKIYCDKMEDFLNKKYIRKISNEEIEERHSKIWYLPHFGVVNPNKPNKLRIVFDASAKSNGFSLNDYLLSGPDLYNSLHTILLNFRIKRFAFTADIKEMFLQVKVRKEDCRAQRFLWRGMDRNRDPDIYEVCVVFFGSSSGPCLAQEAKNRNAYDFKNDYPEVCKAIVDEHYMDDYLGNADSIEEARKLIQDIIYVHSKGGFTICNWISNTEEILDNIDEKLKNQGQKRVEGDPEKSIERILGVFWNPREDTFVFQIKFHKINKDILENKRRPTKREILKVVMSVFDPLGFLTNILIQGKILLQDIWRSKLGWDDEVTDRLNEKWQFWLNDLKYILEFKIPRQYFSLNRISAEIQLHLFCDASEKSYATVAYLRCLEGTDVQTAFVNAKARVTPLKPVSIPRLELQAALMGARLGKYLKDNLNLTVTKIFYWTDSKTVLYWIRSEAQRFKVFVAQRLGEIHTLTNSQDWRYVSSKENVADEATKRLLNLDFSSESRWLYGPKFLKLSPGKWPEEKHIQLDKDVELKTTTEERNDYVFIIASKYNIPIPDVKRFSKWTKFLRTTAWMLRFIRNCKNTRQHRDSRPNTLQELDKNEILMAENIIFKRIQEDSFLEEIDSLKNNKFIAKSSKIFNLTCILDENGILRLGGRLNNLQTFDEDFKNPIILDPNHLITRLIIQHYHDKIHHHGQDTLLNNLRRRFWIIRARQAMKSVYARCQTCKNRKSTPQIPIMGQLPSCRLETTIRPFIKTGVDYFGPLLVTVKRSHEKRYGVIFTCMTTRAVHLDIAHDLTTDGFIHVLRQFGCRRGFPEEIYSDNGTNFKSSEKELREALDDINQNEIIRFCAMNNINWHFNPPSAPHMGGVWERLIQSIKKILGEILKTKYPQEYVLRTLFMETENILNSRPLTHVSLDPEDPEPLTPNHFLIGPKYGALPCVKTDERDLTLLSKWRAAQRLTDIFWQRWTHEYLPYLVTRKKWHQESIAVKLNDIVVIIDPNGPRNIWPKGRVIQLYPAKDGKIRIVDVKLANGTVLKRPVSRLCVLDVQTSQDPE